MASGIVLHLLDGRTWCILRDLQNWQLVFGWELIIFVSEHWGGTGWNKQEQPENEGAWLGNARHLAANPFLHSWPGQEPAVWREAQTWAPWPSGRLKNSRRRPACLGHLEAVWSCPWTEWLGEAWCCHWEALITAAYCLPHRVAEKAERGMRPLCLPSFLFLNRKMYQGSCSVIWL